MEIDIEAVRSLCLNRTTGARKRWSKNGERSARDCGVVAMEESPEITKLRLCISACKQRAFNAKMPLGILEDELFRVRYLLGLERMSCLELANRRRVMARLLLMFTVVLFGFATATSSSHCKTSPVKPVAVHVEAAAESNAYEEELTAEPEDQRDVSESRYQAPFLLPEPAASKKPLRSENLQEVQAK